MLEVFLLSMFVLAPAGVVKIGVQLTLFVAMLFLLLSAKQDPFQQAVRILPMSEAARYNTAASFSEALRGVFQSALKLAVFHAVFTWLTFRAFSIQLVYVPALLSAVCATLPLVQVWMVAIPAALQLILQVRCQWHSHKGYLNMRYGSPCVLLCLHQQTFVPCHKLSCKQSMLFKPSVSAIQQQASTAFLQLVVSVVHLQHLVKVDSTDRSKLIIVGPPPLCMQEIPSPGAHVICAAQQMLVK